MELIQSFSSSSVSAERMYSWTFQWDEAWAMRKANWRSESLRSMRAPANEMVAKGGPSSFPCSKIDSLYERPLFGH